MNKIAVKISILHQSATFNFLRKCQIEALNCLLGRDES